MAQGDILILYRDLEAIGVWELDTFAVDFRNQADIIGGQTLTGTPTVTAHTPRGAQPLTLGTPSISGTQVIFTITLPNGAPAGFVYSISCTCSTSSGNRLVEPVGLDAISAL